MYFIIYKTTNKINGKIYIGLHKQKGLEFDGYYGSGILLHRAIEKYGEENFIRETLFVFDNMDDCRKKEREIVNEEFCISDMTYNISVGGTGGNTIAGYDEETKNKLLEKRSVSISESWKNLLTEEKLNKYRENCKRIRIQPDNKGRIHTEESKENMRNNNHMLKKMFITNGIDTLLVLKTDDIPEGWRKGRTLEEDIKFKGHTKETTKKMAEKRKGKKYYTDGETNRLFSDSDIIPDGWWNGLSSHKRQNMMWITNGTETMKISCEEEIPNGWRKGRVLWKAKK